MINIHVVSFLLVTLLLLAPSVSASGPQLVNYQGQLTDSEGTPISGTVSITFTIYNAPTDGDSKWTEPHGVVAVSNGLFNVLLGSVNSIPDSVFNAPDRYLGIQVGANPEITPRSRLVTAPWSFRVNTVDGAAGGTVIGDVSIVGRAGIGAGNSVTGLYGFASGLSNVNSGDYGFVAGQINQTTNTCASVGGGGFNHATGEYSVIGGGGGPAPTHGNVASGDQSTVGGGQSNEASGDFSIIGGGLNNSAVNGAMVGGGSYNSASGNNSSITGGTGNNTTLDNAFVGGGNSNTSSGSATVVGGGISNIASGQQAAVLGGWTNIAEAMYAAVGGGYQNTASGQYATVAGGRENHALGNGSTIAGGFYDTAGVYCAITGGFQNVATGTASSIGGGWKNLVNGSASVVAGGDSNLVTGNYSAIGGGSQNQVVGDNGVICGGLKNMIEGGGLGCFIGGGGLHPDGKLDNPGDGANLVSGDYSLIVGGADNYVNGEFYNSILGGERNSVFSCINSWIGGGLKNSIGELGSYRNPNYSVVCGGELNKMLGSWSFIGTGFDNEVFGDASAIVSGGYLTSYDMGSSRWVFINQIDTNAAYSFIGTGWGNRASDSCSLVLGGVHNYARGKFSLVVGGGADFDPLLVGPFVTVDSNSASGDYGVILGGRGHVAGGFASAVGGGSYNRATGDYAVISGGGGSDISYANAASGNGSTIGGGARNTASGTYATVPGGYTCQASGNFSTACGRNAAAVHYGSFVWADGNTSTFTSSYNNQFAVRASGGARFYSNATATIGVQLAPGSGTWSSVSDSTLKQNIREVDYNSILQRVAELPVSMWSYKGQAEDIEHIGPMSQDFHRLFGVGDNNTTISTIDSDGIALAAIKALNEKSMRVDELEVEVAELRKLVDDLIANRSQ